VRGLCLVGRLQGLSLHSVPCHRINEMVLCQGLSQSIVHSLVYPTTGKGLCMCVNVELTWPSHIRCIRL